MKKIIKIFLVLGIIFTIFSFTEISFAENIKGLSSINGDKITSNTNVANGSKDIIKRAITIVRNIFLGILVIYMVYAGGQMILSMGKNEESLSKAKRSLWYGIIGALFLMFPIAIYNLIISGSSNDGNILAAESNLINFIKQVVYFLEAVVGAIAVFVLILTGINIILSGGKEEAISKAKTRVLWVLIALIFIGFIEVWQRFLVAKGGLDVGVGVSIFRSIANFALYLAAPIALLFLVFAGYYYITANGDAEKTKKGKNIVINTIIGVIILLCAYVFLNDLSTLTF